VNPNILAAHKAVLAAQACLDAVQQCLIVLLKEDEQKPSDGCDHPVEARLTVETMNGREELCNVCGANIRS